MDSLNIKYLNSQYNTQQTTKATVIPNMLFIKANIPVVAEKLSNTEYEELNHIATSVAHTIQQYIKEVAKVSSAGNAVGTGATKKLQQDVLSALEGGILQVADSIAQGKIKKTSITSLFNTQYPFKDSITDYTQSGSLYAQVYFVLLNLVQNKLRFLDKQTGMLEDATITFNSILKDPIKDKDAILYDSYNKHSVDVFNYLTNVADFFNKDIHTQEQRYNRDLPNYIKKDKFNNKTHIDESFLSDIKNLSSLFSKLDTMVKKGKKQYPSFISTLLQHIKDNISEPKTLNYIQELLDKEKYTISAEKFINYLFSWYTRKYNLNSVYHDNNMEEFDKRLHQPTESATSRARKQDASLTRAVGDIVYDLVRKENIKPQKGDTIESYVKKIKDLLNDKFNTAINTTDKPQVKQNMMKWQTAFFALPTEQQNNMLVATLQSLTPILSLLHSENSTENLAAEKTNEVEKTNEKELPKKVDSLKEPSVANLTEDTPLNLPSPTENTTKSENKQPISTEDKQKALNPTQDSTSNITDEDIQKALDSTKEFINVNYKDVFPSKYNRAYLFQPALTKKKQTEKEIVDKRKQQAEENKLTPKQPRTPLPTSTNVGDTNGLTFYGLGNVGNTPQPDAQPVPDASAEDTVKLEFLSKVPNFNTMFAEIKNIITDPNSEYNKLTSPLLKMRLRNTKVATLIGAIQDYVKLNFGVKKVSILNTWIAAFINNQLSK